MTQFDTVIFSLSISIKILLHLFFDLWLFTLTFGHATPTSENTMQTHKRYKTTLFIRTKHNKRIFGVILFMKLQNDT